MSERFDPHDPKQIESFKMQVNSLIDSYLNQKPSPGISEFAEAFGAEDYITELKRKRAVKVDVKAFKEEILKRLIEQSENSGVEVILPQAFEMLQHSILPPDEGEIKAGGGGIEKKKYIPRTQYLIKLLSEMGESYEMIGGRNSSDMMRERTYFIFFLPNSEKAIFVNNEEGNTTFILYQVDSKEGAINLAALTKDEIRAKELHTHPYAQIDWTGDEESWKGSILKFLTLENLPEGEVVKSHLVGDIVSQSSGAESKRNRTLESAVSELEVAYKLWKAEDEKERGEFNTTWLRKKGFEGLYQWTRKKKIDLKKLVSQASLELQKDFDKVDRHTPESALSELEQAYLKWKAQDEKNKGKFNSLWLQENEHHGLYMWAYRNGGVDALVLKASKDLQGDFERLERQSYTKESALALLEKAYQKWKVQDEKARGKFNLQWLKNNDFDPLVQWVYRHGGFDIYINASSKELQSDYQKREEKFFLSFDELKKDVKEKGIRTVTEYQEKYELFDKWPSDPSTRYKDQWTSWPSFLGKK